MAGLCEDWEDVPLTLSDSQREWYTWHHSMATVQQTADSSESIRIQHGDSRDIALGWVGLAAVQVATGEWKEAKNSVEKGTVSKMIVCSWRQLTWYCT